ncbi:MAG TPA: YibE/F family protein [Candidatus Paceibacterota bacterium]|nr:YibE/F family protein [Candidatus Paceibacterota bacterium]
MRFSAFNAKAIGEPNRIVVLGIFIISLAWLFFGTGRLLQGSSGSGDNAIRFGTVEHILSEEERPAGRFQSQLYQRVTVTLESGDSVIAENDVIRLREGMSVWLTVQAEGTDAESYFVVLPQRGNGIALLAALFGGLVVLVAGMHGVRALVGLAASLAIILGGLIPWILRGGNPVVAGLTCALLILMVTLYVTHGLNRKSLSALLGILLALCVVAVLTYGSVNWLALTGYGSEEVLYLRHEAPEALNFAALLIAGIVVAALGVLDDVAITQVSTVRELASSNPALRGMPLFTKAMVVGRDHIAAVTNTLVLAYVGSSLPLLLLFGLKDFPLSFIVSGDLLAEQIILTLLSSMGLVLAVPFSTAIAVLWQRPEKA